MTKRRLSYRWVFGWSWLALLLERLWDSYWAVLCLAGLYAGLAFSTFLFFFGAAVHFWLALGFAVAVFAAAWYVGPRFALPTVDDVERRMEQAAGLKNRPLQTLRDQPAAGSPPAAQELWARHRLRTEAALAHLRVYRPRTTVPQQDRFGLRHIVLVFLLGSAVIAGPLAPARLSQGLQPALGAVYTPRPVALDAWIVPPQYTARAPVFLASTQSGAAVETGAISVPAGSVLKLRLSGYKRPPAVRYGDERLDAETAGTGNYVAEFTLTQSARLSIRQGLRRLGGWDIAVTPDEAPEIELLTAAPTQRAALKITYRMRDDYGLRQVTGRITPPAELAARLRDVPMDFNIPLSTAESENKVHIEDLTAHILAGARVTLTLEAEDNAGNVAQSAPVELFLPERKFNNPTAQRLIVERKRLLWFDGAFAAGFATQTMLDVVNRPAFYKGDIVVFLALATAIKRLGYDGDAESRASVRDMLWDVALKIEDGGLSMAARDLSQALQKLAEGLKDKEMSRGELDELVQEVQKQMQQYMQALANEMQQRMEQGQKQQQMSPEMAEKLMQHIDMEELMREMREMAQGNSREQMQKMAEMLKNAVDNFDPQKMQEMQEKQQQAVEAMQKMEELIQRQQQLMDKTGKKQPKENSQEEAGEQKSIRDQLGDAARAMSQVMPQLPDSMGEADQRMKQASDKLGGNLPRESLGDQKAALDALQQGQSEMMKQIAQGMRQMMLSFGGMPRGQGTSGNYGEGYDPLGREDGSSMTNESDVKIPEEAERRRVQEIIRELRERSNEQERPKVEREYIDRLLDMFY